MRVKLEKNHTLPWKIPVPPAINSRSSSRLWLACARPAAARGIANRPSTPSNLTPWKRPTKCSTPSTAASGTNWPKSWAISCCRPSSTPRWPPSNNCFNIDDALDAINQKLVRRHPHVFGEESAETAGDVKRIWGEVKAEEKKDKGREQDGLLAPVPRALPALVEAQQIASRAAGAGFDWENPDQVLDKLHEELAEFAEARRQASHDELENEMGDLLFVLVNLARFVKVDPEQALRRTNAKFRKRFELHRAQTGRARQEAGRFQHRRNGGAVAGSQAVIEIRQLFQLRRVRRGAAPAADHLGLRRYRTAPAALSGGGDQGRRPRLRRLRRRPDGRILLRHPRHQARRPALPAQPHAGRAAGVPQPGDRPQPQTAAARRRTGARHRADRVDLRSAGVEERLLQHRAPGRHRAPLSRRTSTASPPARCTADCPPTAATPNGGSIRPRVELRLAQSPGGSGGATRESDRLPRRYRRASAPKIRHAPARSRRRTARNFADAFAHGLAVTGFERGETEGTYLLEPWQ